MSLLKERSSYRPTRLESTLSWVFTLGSVVVLAWVVLCST
jgi:hypothetical protein